VHLVTASAPCLVLRLLFVVQQLLVLVLLRLLLVLLVLPSVSCRCEHSTQEEQKQ
jgi:hypothetical protein